MPTRRENIKNFIKTKLEEISALGTVYVENDNFISETDSGVTMPIVNIMIANDEINLSESSLGYSQHYLEIIIAVLTENNDTESLYQQITSKLFEDTTLGGYVDYIMVSTPSVDLRYDDYNDIDNLVASYVVTYQLPNGSV